ncbi:hypothetical protein [Amorphus sp. 3PC139-8]|uniref:hypothetical protein n=1 Tax=Amorphus sp. 3PC139-8 TaxID=2735676 RepID=UPI00345DC415
MSVRFLEKISVSRSRFFLVGVLCIGFTVLYALNAGQDVNFDQRNYHFYDAYAFLNGRHAVDVTAAGVHSFLNPLPYVIDFLLAQHFSPVVTSAIISAVQGLNLLLVFVLCERMLVSASAGTRFLLALAATLMAASSPTYLAELGTTFSDAATSILVLGGVVLLVHVPAGVRGSGAWQTAFGGFLVGAAAALKLTNAIFALAVVPMVLLGPKWRNRYISILLLACGGVGGALLFGGAWHFQLWQTYGNPTFPFYNQIFASPEFPLENIRDHRWQVDGLWQAIYGPLQMAFGVQSTNELDFRDARYLLLGLVILGALTAYGVRRGSAAKVDTVADIDRIRERLMLGRLGAFFIVAGGLWTVLFYIQRYALPLELIAGPLIVALIWQSSTSLILNWRVPVAVSLVCALVLVFWNETYSWGRVPFQDAWYELPDVPEFNGPAAYLVVDKAEPISWLFTELDPESRIYRLGSLPIEKGGTFDRKIREGLASPPGGIVRLVTVEGTNEEGDLALHRYGLSKKACRHVRTTFETLNVCTLIDRTSAGVAVENGIEVGKKMLFADGLNGQLLKDGWSRQESWGVWTEADTATITLDTGGIESPLSGLAIHFQPFFGPGMEDQTLRVLINGKRVASWELIRISLPQYCCEMIVPLPDAVEPGQEIEVEFEIAKPTSPKSLGLSKDDRPLGIGLIDMTILAESLCPSMQELTSSSECTPIRSNN